MNFYTLDRAGSFKDDLKIASPKNWRDFMAIGMGATKESAKAKAHQMAKRTIDAPCTEEELAAVISLIDRRNDVWPE